MLVFLYSGLNHIVKILGLSHDSIGVPVPRCRTGWDSVLWVLSQGRAKLVCFPSLRCDSVWGLFYALNVGAQWGAGNVLVPFFSQWNDTARDCFVDDILLIFYSNRTSIQTILDDFYTVHPSLKFTVEMETNSTINYLDVTIHKPPTGWRTSIYRKPTFTDTIIPYTSNHTTQHKYTAIKFYTTDWTHTTYLQKATSKKKTLYTISCTTLSWSTHQSHPPESRKNIWKPHRQHRKSGSHSPIQERKRTSLQTFSDELTSKLLSVQTTENRQIHMIRGIQTHMPWLKESVYGSNR